MTISQVLATLADGMLFPMVVSDDLLLMKGYGVCLSTVHLNVDNTNHLLSLECGGRCDGCPGSINIRGATGAHMILWVLTI